MLVVIGSRHDRCANAMVARWRSDEAALLSAEDLSSPGWRYHVGCPEMSTAVVGGTVVGVGDIDGVLTRRPWVFEQELAHVEAVDRAYVAAEMNAMLLSWLSELPCTVLNRPTTTCLGGPNWRPQQWLLAATRAGLRVRPARAAVAPPGLEARDEVSSDSHVEVTVVGRRCFGARGVLAANATRLAAVGGVELLGARFATDLSSEVDGDAWFVGANPWPDLSNPAVADAVRDHLAGRGRR